MNPIQVIIMTIIGIVVVFALFKAVKTYPQPVNAEEARFKKVQSQRRWFIVIFGAVLFFTVWFAGSIVSSMNGFGWLVALLALALVMFIYVNSTKRVWWASLAAVAAFALIITPASIAGFNSYTDSPVSDALAQGATDQDEGAANLSGEEAWQHATGSGSQPKPGDCVAQSWYHTTNGRFKADGLNTEGLETTAESADAVQRQMINQDARYLAEAAWYEKLYDDPSNVAPLITEDKACLSKEGLKLRDAVVAKWDLASIKIVASVVGINTARAADGSMVRGGNVTGDTTSLVRTHSNGQTSTTMTRCGNFVLPPTPTPPKPRPPKPTPPPEPTPTPTPTPSCTPGPEKCKEDDRLNNDPVNPAPSPSGTPETEAPIEENPAGPPSENPPGGEAPELPAEGVEPGTGETPRTDIPDVPVDVPSEPGDAPIEGDQDPDAKTSTTTKDRSSEESKGTVAPATEDQKQSKELVDSSSDSQGSTDMVDSSTTDSTQSGVIGEAETSPPAMGLMLGSLGLLGAPFLRRKRR